MECYRIDRGQGLSPVRSCDGPGDVAVFYTNAVWFCAGLTLAFLFLQGGSTQDVCPHADGTADLCFSTKKSANVLSKLMFTTNL